MVTPGYLLSSEDHSPMALVDLAARAEQAGFEALWIGDKWPTPEVRPSMLKEAVEVMRKLWAGGVVDHDGQHYLVENAQLFDLPETPPPVLVSAFGPKAVARAARICDGDICTTASSELVDAYQEGFFSFFERKIRPAFAG